jgi:PST family polysaccharide transporter
MAAVAGSDDDLRTDDLHEDLPRRSVLGGAAVLTAQAGTVLLGLLSAAVLARLLTPADFGLLAMAGAFVALIANFAELGLPSATVQQSEVSDEQVSALFWINLAVGAVATVVGIGAAWPIATFYGEPALLPITAALSLGFLVAGASAQHQALLRRRMRFGVLGVVTVASTAAGIAVAIAAAVLGAGYWALVALALATAVFRTAGLWGTCRWRPRRPARAAGLRPMIRFGAYLTGTNVLGAIVRSLDRILIGRAFGAAAAGYYTNAHRLLVMPVQQLNMPLTSVALPTLSRLQNDPERFRLFYRRGLEAIAAVAFPAILACLISADHLVPTVLGDQWTDSVAIFRALAPAALLASFNVATSWVYVPLGRSDRQFRWHVFRSACVVAAYVIGLRWGPVGVAAAFSITACILRVPAILYCLHGTFVELSDIRRATWRTAVAAAVAAAATVPLALRLGANGAHVTALVIEGAAFAGVYTLAWLVVPGGRARLAENLATLRYLLPGRDRADGATSSHNDTNA